MYTSLRYNKGFPLSRESLDERSLRPVLSLGSRGLLNYRLVSTLRVSLAFACGAFPTSRASGVGRDRISSTMHPSTAEQSATKNDARRQTFQTTLSPDILRPSRPKRLTEL